MRLAALALVCVACGTASSSPPSSPPPPPPAVQEAGDQPPAAASAAPAAAPAEPTCTSGRRRLTTARRAEILYVTRATVARREPRRGAEAVARLGPDNAYGLRQVLLGLEAQVGSDCAPTWYRVKLPAKPNGVTGWVPAAGLVTSVTGSRIVVDLSARRLDLYRRGERVRRATIAIGHVETPTPTGTFYVDVRYRLTDRGGPYGPALLGLAAYSEADQGWAAGNPIAIHGTNAPSLIGSRASNGCIRVTNDEILRLMDDVPAGTPVVIRA
jgi:lipoprotein-anchoring transpeptidase ErfK/SrfK